MHVRDLTQYLAELAENNNRAWFVMNKPRCDILRGELLELTIKLIKGISKFDPAVADCNAKKALFRINRDLRFSREKIPYKTHFSVAINPHNLKKPSQGGGPTYYFHIDETGTLLFAAGEYMPPPDRLRVIRQHLIDDASGFTKVLKNKRLTQRYGELQQEGKLIRPPKGFDMDAPHIEHIKLKSFIVWNKVGALQAADTLEQTLLSAFHDAYPLVTWLRQAK